MAKTGTFISVAEDQEGKLPRIVTETEGLPVLQVDAEGKTPMSTLFGELTVGQRRDDISVQFQYNNATKDVKEAVSGTGVADNNDSMAEVSTGTGVGSASITSLDSVRYRPGHECVAMQTIIFDENEAGVNQKGGLLNDDDGLAFGYQGTAFGVWFIEGGNTNFYAQSEWNHDKLDGTGASGFDLDPSKMNIYKISFGWLGIAPIYFTVFAGHKKGWVLCHVIDRVNIDAEPHLQNPSLPLRVIIDRESGTGVNCHIHTSSWRAGVIGEDAEGNSSDRVFTYNALEITVPSATPTAVLIVRSKATYQGKSNHVKARPIIITFDTAGNKPVLILGVPNPTYGTTPTFSDRDTVNSMMEFALGPHEITSTIPGGVPATVMGRNDSRELDSEKRKLIIYPGQELAIIAESSQATEISTSWTILEEF